ncbi:MAG: GH3 auxin-responsive promoter family protein, partial [Bacteroidales bacterium]|nr:GH3 auxin-responsive promoter family protein [Bacteroidales bacterium]
NLELFMHGGINFEPYRSEYKRIIPSESMKYLENYNASEGYFAFQDDPGDRSMLLMVNGGVFYEFIPLDKLSEALDGDFNEFDTVESVKTGVNYAMVITTNGGLWRYLIGDSVSFTSLRPHKLIITGRTQLFINAFGEELMIGNAERALSAACDAGDCSVENFTVAPLFMKEGGKGSHQWLIEFSRTPPSIEKFADLLDLEICKQNSDYEAKRAKNSTMVRLSVVNLKSGTFYKWQKEKGKLGGQNKIPRLSSKRDIAEDLIRINSEE